MRSQVHISQYKKLRRRRLAGRLLWSLAAAALTGGILYLFTGWLLNPVIVRHIEQRTGGKVYIDSAYWIAPGKIRLQDMILKQESEDQSAQPLVRIGHADCSLSLIDMFVFRIKVKSIEVSEAAITVEYDADNKKWNFTDLRFLHEDTGKKPFPAVDLSGVQLRVQADIDDEKQLLTAVELNGSIVSSGANGEYAVRVEATDQAGFKGSRLDGFWSGGSEGKLLLGGRICMPSETVLGNSWNLENILLDCRYTKNQLSLKELSFGMGAGQAQLSGTLEKTADGHDVDLDLGLENFELARRLKKDALVYSRSVLSMLPSGLSNFLYRFRPEGTGDVQLKVHGNLSDLPGFRADGYILCRNAAVSDRRYPYVLEDISGAAELRGKDLVHNFMARHGQASFRIEGGIDNMGPHSRVYMRVRGRDVQFDEDLYRALPEEAQKVWFSFAPSGSGLIDYRFLRRPDKTKEQRMQVDIRNAGVVYDRFPYPIQNLTGTIIFEPNRIELVNVNSQNPRRIEVNGIIEKIRTGEPEYDVQIRAHRIPIDQTLRNAFVKSQRAFLDELELDGQADLDLQFRNTERRPFPIEYEAVMNVTASNIICKRFPLPLKDAVMHAALRPDSFSIRSFYAVRGESDLRLSGGFKLIGADGKRPGGFIDFKAQSVQMDGPFWQAVSEAKVYPELFSRVRAQGSIDLGGRLSLNDPDGKKSRLEIRCSADSLLSPASEWKSGPARGSIIISTGSIEAADWRIKDIPVNDSFAELFADPLRRKLLNAKIDAAAEAQIRSAVFSRQQEDFRLEAAGSLLFRDAAVGSLALSESSGIFDGKLGADSRHGLLHFSGNLNAESFRILDRPFSGLTADWNMDPGSRMLSAERIKAQCGGGDISGKLNINLSDMPAKYISEVSFKDVQLSTLFPVEKAEKDREPVEGTLEGNIAVGGTFEGFNAAEGKIHLDAKDLKLGRETLMGKAFTVMQLRKQADYVFTEMTADAVLDDSVLSSGQILFAGKNDVYQGKGRIDLKNATIDMQLTAFGHRKGQERTLLSTLAENLGATLAMVEVKGSLNDPQIRSIPLPVIQRPLEILGSKAE